MAMLFNLTEKPCFPCKAVLEYIHKQGQQNFPEMEAIKKEYFILQDPTNATKCIDSIWLYILRYCLPFSENGTYDDVELDVILLRDTIDRGHKQTANDRIVELLKAVRGINERQSRFSAEVYTQIGAGRANQLIKVDFSRCTKRRIPQSIIGALVRNF
ncbi:hypothetical protein ACJ72_04207 [Emergomyces africanus]|uniref:Uncharacterized protein n=1 Tax=Emergomyces africanus TaxID=1955775 RepID=A0A1B7NXV9_9EURO|nr:hypothetical protein ACJ72_04207 [Emergomyces africanus]